MHFPELDAKRVICRCSCKRDDRLFQSSGPGFKNKGLNRRECQHYCDEHQGRDGEPASVYDLTEEGHGPTGKSPAKISGEKDADHTSGDIPGVRGKDERGEEEGEQGRPTQPAADSKIVYYCNIMHFFSRGLNGWAGVANISCERGLAYQVGRNYHIK